MLRTIGVNSVEQLFEDVPADARFPELDLPPALTEFEVGRYMAGLAAQNVSVKDWPCFIGGGAYNHYSPAAVGHIMGQPQFYTAYTPYQPEVSQGTLQASFEFQSLVAELLGMDIANDSVYDGASAVGEAVLMAQRITRRDRVVVAGSVHPQWRDVVRSYVSGRGLEIVTPSVTVGPSGLIQQRLVEALDGDTACVTRLANVKGINKNGLARLLKNNPGRIVVTSSN